MSVVLSLTPAQGSVNPKPKKVSNPEFDSQQVWTRQVYTQFSYGEFPWFLLGFIFYFYLYIYPPDSQESDGGAIHRVSNYPDLLPKMPRYCCPLVI